MRVRGELPPWAAWFLPLGDYAGFLITYLLAVWDELSLLTTC